jgi:hypothetical protein
MVLKSDNGSLDLQDHQLHLMRDLVRLQMRMIVIVVATMAMGHRYLQAMQLRLDLPQLAKTK